eukprot:CAMPEP_0116936762 /NCGR_PEP_ID=MMETSP0467-20121206/31085_1 /TAXON_ID=283647 /ORGANISM="Mesodinium pulex, Strain SPMC105" /LENGTH=87 /DNA_ID=CAMNT_0004618415 /DNA_START=636 /DNA_END=899 /DNA_ORIENTATION=+
MNMSLSNHRSKEHSQEHDKDAKKLAEVETRVNKSPVQFMLDRMKSSEKVKVSDTTYSADIDFSSPSKKKSDKVLNETGIIMNVKSMN